jgi:hypothetical protein
MGIKKSLQLNSSIINKILLLLLLITFLIKSLNGFLRWDLNQHIGMVDNFILDGDFYPTDENLYSPVSIYPMGVRLISLFFYKIGGNEYLINTMLTLASVILFITFILITKNSYNKKEKYDNSVVPLTISYVLLCCGTFVFYSTEFKPDTISLLFCFLGLFLFLKNKKLIIISSILIGISVLFKQHSIGFIIGLWMFSLIFFKHPIKYLSLFSTLIYFSLFFYIYSFDQIKFYSFDVVSDDGIKSFFSILIDIYSTIKSILIFIFLLLFTVETRINLKEIKNILIYLYKNPYSYISLSVFGISFLGSIINGGNDGNIQVGLFFSLPVIIIIIQRFKINYSKSVIICVISFFMTSSQLLSPIKSFFERNELIEFVNTYYNNHKIEHILTDSNSYSIIRDFRYKGSKIDDYYTPQLVNRNFRLNKLNWKRYDLAIFQKSDNDIIKESKFHGFNILKESENFIIFIPQSEFIK